MTREQYEAGRDHIRPHRIVSGLILVAAVAIYVHLTTSGHLAPPSGEARNYVGLAVWLAASVGMFQLVKAAPPVWRWLNAE